MGNTNHLCACIEKLNQGSVIVDTNNKNNILSQINESKNAFNSKTNIPNIQKKESNNIKQTEKTEVDKKKEKKKIFQSESSTEGKIGNNNIELNKNEKSKEKIDNKKKKISSEKKTEINNLNTINNSNNNNNNNNSTNNINNNSKNNTNDNNIINTKPKKIKSKNEKTILIYGEHESGKTSFVLKICNNKFDIFYIPSFADENTKKTLILNQKKFNIEFIVSNDTSEIKEADCYLIFYDLTSMTSYNIAKNLIIEKITKLNKPIFLIGNKSDLRNKISIPDLKNFCNDYKCVEFQISIKENIGVSSVLKNIGDIFNYEDEN